MRIERFAQKADEIVINIWDDFYDDGFIPEGKIQDTHIYVEEYELDDNGINVIIDMLLDYINDNISLEGVEFSIRDRSRHSNETVNEIYVKHMTHKQLHQLMKDLKICTLSWWFTNKIYIRKLKKLWKN